MSKYPDYLPTSAVEFCMFFDERMRPIDTWSDTAKLYDRLVYGCDAAPDMGSAWTRLNDRFPSLTGRDGYCPHSLMADIGGMFDGLDRVVDTALTKRQQIDKKNKVSNAVKSLHDVIKGSEYEPLFHFMDDRVNQKLFELLERDLKGCHSIVSGESKGVIYGGDFIKDKFGDSNQWPVALSSSGFLNQQLNEQSVSGLLMNISAKIDSDIDQIEGMELLIPSPSGKGSRRLYVIRWLAGVFSKNFGSPMKGTLAKFASAILDENISVDQVSDALKR